MSEQDPEPGEGDPAAPEPLHLETPKWEIIEKGHERPEMETRADPSDD